MAFRAEHVPLPRICYYKGKSLGSDKSGCLEFELTMSPTTLGGQTTQEARDRSPGREGRQRSKITPHIICNDIDSFSFTNIMGRCLLAHS